MSLTCPDLYRLIFQTFYHTSLISPKREIDETVNFRNFRKLFTNKFSAFLWDFGTHFQTEKTKEVMTRHTKHAAMAVTLYTYIGKVN